MNEPQEDRRHIEDVYQGIIDEMGMAELVRTRRILYGVLAFSAVIIILLLVRPPRVNTVEVGWFKDSNGIIQRFTQLDDTVIGHEEGDIRGDINMYVIYHETYGKSLYSDRSFVQRFSTPEVFDEYWAVTKPIYDSVKKSMSARVEVQNIIINSEGIATVRYLKHIKTDTGSSSTKSYTATMTYEYLNFDYAKSKTPFDDGILVTERDMNPDGFTVTSWRVTADTVQGSGL